MKDKKLTEFECKTKIKDLLEFSDTKTELSLYIYELEELTKSKEYCDFEIWSEDEHTLELTQSDIVLKIALNKQDEIENVYKSVFDAIIRKGKMNYSIFQWLKCIFSSNDKRYSIEKALKIFRIDGVEEENKEANSTSKKNKRDIKMQAKNEEKKLTFKIIKLLDSFELKEKQFYGEPKVLGKEQKQEKSLTIHDCFSQY